MRRLCPSLLSWLAIALFACTVLHGAQPATAQPPDQAAEAEVKAVFLVNFARYVDWPAAAAGTSAAIRMCVPTNDQFLAVLREAVRDEVVNGRPISTHDLDGLDAAKECDILYVGASSTADAAAWIAAVRGRQVLTVGDGRLVNGLVIAFVRDEGRIRFDINREAAGKQGLTISSRLLGLARRVSPF